MSRVRSKRQGRNYAAIPNAAMRDTALSLEARGMLALMMGYSDDWTFFRAHLMEVAGVGREKFQRIMAELQGAGYVTRETLRGEGGHVAGTTYVIHDDPSASTEGLKTRSSAEGLKNRPPVEPTAGKPVPIRKNNSQEEQTLKKTKARDAENDLFFKETVEGMFLDILGKDLTDEWLQHRKELKKKLTLSTAKRQRAMLQRQSNPRAVVERSIEKGWTGLFDLPKDYVPPASSQPATKFDPDNPLSGIPESYAQIIRLELDQDQRVRMAQAYWAKQRAAE